MIYEILLRDNETGEIRMATEEHGTEESVEFIWSDGNNRCDCNRALLFARAGGQDKPDGTPCGHERFSVLAVAGVLGPERREIAGSWNS